MSEISVILKGWEGKRQLISELTLYAEDGEHRMVGQLSLPPETTAARLDLAGGRVHLYTLFTSAPYVYYTGADPIEVPFSDPITLDLDQATIDDVLQPPP